MDIGFTALWVLSFLTPGFGILFGMRVGSRFDIKTIKQNNASGIILILWLSCLINFILWPSFDHLPFSDTLLNYIKGWNVANQNATPESDISKLKDWLYITPYVFFSAITSFVLGLIFIVLIERGVWFFRTQMFHGSMYKIISGRSNPIIFCSVMTKSKYDNYYLMYKGMLSEISYSSGYKIEYVCLEFSEKYLLKIDSEKEEVFTCAKKTNVSYGDSYGNEQNELLIINGSEIENILFTQIMDLETPQNFWKTIFKKAVIYIKKISSKQSVVSS